MKSKSPKDNTIRFLGVNVTIDKNMRDFSKEEFFIRKAQIVEEFLAKHPFPKEFLTTK